MITIYEIYNDLDSDSYVGSTSNSIFVRFLQHHLDYASGKNSCSSAKLFEKNIELKIRPIERIPRQK